MHTLTFSMMSQTRSMLSFFAHVKHYTELHPDFQIHQARVPAATAHAGALSARTQALPWGARSHLLSAGIKNRLYRNDRLWREAVVRPDDEVRKVPTRDSCTAANDVHEKGLPRPGR
jgi:hypothetical protein